MHSISVLAVATQAHPSVMDAVPHLAGMLMVMATLTILWGVCALTAKLIRILIPSSSAPPVAAANVNQPQPDAITPEIVAVIVAAVAAVNGESQRIIAIKPMNTSWEKAGRQSVFSSHRIR